MRITCPHCGKPIEFAGIASELGKKGGSSTSERKKAAILENLKKSNGRPKGSKNKAPRSDKGVPRGPRNKAEQ